MVTLRDVEYEDIVGHGEGGYMPLYVNDALDNGRFIVRLKLGIGKFSVVWKCWDSLSKTDVAIKVGRCSKRFARVSKYEAVVMAAGAEKIPGMDPPHVFEAEGPHGLHVCVVLPLRGQTLMWVLDVLDYNETYLPVDLVASWTADLAEDLEALHNVGYIHSDIKTDNILLNAPVDLMFEDITEPSQMGLRPGTDYLMEIAKAEMHGVSDKRLRHLNRRLSRLRKSAAAGTRDVSALHIPAAEFDYDEFVRLLRERYAVLTDFSNAILESAVREHDTEFQSKEYRCPEVLLGLRFTTQSDLWSIGCIIFELATNDMLFEPKDAPGRWDSDDDHVAQIVELIGLPPVDLVERHLDIASCGKSKSIFREAYVYAWAPNSSPAGDGPVTGPGTMIASPLKRIDKLRLWPSTCVLRDKYHKSEGDSMIISDLMNYMLKWDPRMRDTLFTLITVCRSIARGA